MIYPFRETGLSLALLKQRAFQWAEYLAPGDVVSLQGPMGAGKTTFTRFLGEVLGIQERVTSPTFSLIHQYESGRIPLVHIDLYRLADEESNTLADEILALIEEKKWVLVVEWAEYGPFLTSFINWRVSIAPEEYGDEGEPPRQLVIERIGGE